MSEHPDASPIPFTAEEIQQRIDKVPFSSFLGLRAGAIDADAVELSARLRPEMLGNPEVGAIHGGIFASLLDVACSYALIVPTRRSVVTVNLRVDYHRPGFGDAFSVRAWLVNRGRTLSVAEGEVRASAGKLVASGRAVLMHTKG